MKLLIYNEIDTHDVKKTFDKVVDQLSRGDFVSAEIKKMQNTGYYRAKLDYENRLLLKFARIGEATYLLLLEIIRNHEYEKSRFLRGAEIDEQKLQALTQVEKIPEEDFIPITYINKNNIHFHILDKIISFDEDQHEVFRLPTPLIIIGSAGSGKTALTLEKIKTLKGKILYITLSSHLVENSTNIYYSFDYKNEQQEIDFLSFKDFVQSLQIIPGKEITFSEFDMWFSRHRNTVKIKDSHKLFEEFRGVLTGNDTSKPYLSRSDYTGLGVRQSVFFQEEREQVYNLFEKYLQFITDNRYYDLNIVSHQWLQYSQATYDFVIVDEVQDLTNAQLYLILKSLRTPNNFILCGDSNQIVHPNFFSWSNVKSMFYKTDMLGNDLRILKTNYRNSPEVTTLANTLLKIKHLRFGSIDRESTYLVNAISSKNGEVVYLEDSSKIKQDLNQKTKNSTHFAVLVMNNTDKAEARKHFQTPLLFSIQEAKGLEYDNIILVNFVSNNAEEFSEVCANIDHQSIEQTEELHYSRAKDKSDKSLDAFKYYVNSLYVAFTRAIQNLYIIEANKKHQLLSLLGLIDTKQLQLKEQKSSLEDWQKEAQKLEKQGKQEQTDLIKKNILGIHAPTWTPMTVEQFEKLKTEALDPNFFNKKAKDKIFDYALIFHQIRTIEQLSELKYRRADNYQTEYNALHRRHYAHYKTDDIKQVMPLFNKYGINFRDEFNFTPLMISVKMGSIKITNFLLANGAETKAIGNYGLTAFQIAIQQAYLNKEYIKEKLTPIYHKLLPSDIKIKVNNQLVKIDPRKAEFLILNTIIALQKQIIDGKKYPHKGVTTNDLMSILSSYPDNILPEYRKKRQYINSIMAKNEENRQTPYNKQLFMRRQTGLYVLNPKLEILINEEWKNAYDLIGEPKLYKFHNLLADLVEQDYLGFVGDPNYDLPISHLKPHLQEKERFTTTGELCFSTNGLPEITRRMITHLDSSGKPTISSIPMGWFRMPDHLGGGKVAVHFSAENTKFMSHLSQSIQKKHTIIFELNSDEYAFAHL